MMALVHLVKKLKADPMLDLMSVICHKQTMVVHLLGKYKFYETNNTIHQKQSNSYITNNNYSVNV